MEGRPSAFRQELNLDDHARGVRVARDDVGDTPGEAWRGAQVGVEAGQVLVVLVLRQLDPYAPTKRVVLVEEGQGDDAADEVTVPVKRAKVIVAARALVAAQVGEGMDFVGETKPVVGGKALVGFTAAWADERRVGHGPGFCR